MRHLGMYVYKAIGYPSLQVRVGDTVVVEKHSMPMVFKAKRLEESSYRV